MASSLGLILLVLISILICVSSLDATHHILQRSDHVIRTRRMLEELQEDEEMKKPSKNNKTKLIIKPPSYKNNNSFKNQTKIPKSSSNSTKLSLSKSKLITITNSTSSLKFKNLKSNSTNSKLIKKLNSTSSLLLKSNSTSKLKKLNSTSSLLKSNSISKLKKLNSTSSKLNSTNNNNNNNNNNKTSYPTKNIKDLQKSKNKLQLEEEEEEEDDDLVKEIKDLMKFQQTLIPDLEKISTTSQAYITKYNKQITRNFNPIFGKKYAPTLANIILSTFIIIPLILVSLIINRIKTYFSLQKLLIFIQIYLSIYFLILCLSSLVTGLEPLRFFYAASQSTYVCVLVLQTLGYVLYLLTLLLYLTLVFSTSCGFGAKIVALAQTVVGFGVGVHYYVAVFHRMVLRQPPKTNWKIHGIYATCFFLVCLCARAEGRKKAYLEESGEEGKKN
ncbi:hypothetical protein ACFE04_017432 [Oxalis oulophora]